MATLGTAATARESEVLALLGQHLTNAQIAEALFTSVRTVESHVAALLRKYQVPDRRSLARLVAAAGSAPAHGGLPVPVTVFLGRVAERAELSEALARHRLVTARAAAGPALGADVHAVDGEQVQGPCTTRVSHSRRGARSAAR